MSHIAPITGNTHNGLPQDCFDVDCLIATNRLEAKAKGFATWLHEGQYRKFNGKPYISHPEDMVQIFKANGCKDQVVLSGIWLHDVVEDTPFTLYQLAKEFGLEVAVIVRALTKRPGEGATEMFRHLDDGPSVAAAIKCIDRTVNIRDNPKVKESYLAQGQTIKLIAEKKMRHHPEYMWATSVLEEALAEGYRKRTT